MRFPNVCPVKSHRASVRDKVVLCDSCRGHGGRSRSVAVTLSIYCETTINRQGLHTLTVPLPELKRSGYGRKSEVPFLHTQRCPSQ
jgi:hypothetical protein